MSKFPSSPLDALTLPSEWSDFICIFSFQGCIARKLFFFLENGNTAIYFPPHLVQRCFRPAIINRVDMDTYQCQWLARRPCLFIHNTNLIYLYWFVKVAIECAHLLFSLHVRCSRCLMRNILWKHFNASSLFCELLIVINKVRQNHL